MKPVGVLLAGGQARRMRFKDGAGDKSLRLLGGRPLLAHIIERLAPQVERLALNANGDPARFAAWNLPVIADDIADNPGENPGPMAGILAGMTWAEGAVDIISVPTDTPFLPHDLVARLLAARDAEGADLAVAASGAHVHFATALWPVRLVGALRLMLSDGVRRIEEFQKPYRVAVVKYDTAPGDPFLNINMPEDLAEAEKVVGDARG